VHGYLGDFQRPTEVIFSRSLRCVILFSLLGLAASAIVLVMTAPQRLDAILAMLG
jgi:hypothetical protein